MSLINDISNVSDEIKETVKERLKSSDCDWDGDIIRHNEKKKYYVNIYEDIVIDLSKEA